MSPRHCMFHCSTFFVTVKGFVCTEPFCWSSVLLVTFIEFLDNLNVCDAY
jgi:hypothetical protein